MSGKQSQITRELGKFAQALWFDLPTAMTQRLLGNGDENSLSAAGWKAYDAWVSLANEATNRVYENATVGAITGRSMESALRVQQVGSTVASAFLNNLWPALGLPTADQVAGMRADLAALHNEIAQVATKEDKSVLGMSLHEIAGERLKLVRSNGHNQPTDQEKENAAA